MFFICDWVGDKMFLPVNGMVVRRCLPVNGMVMSPAPVRIPPTSPAHPPLRLEMLQLFLVSSRLSIIGSIPAMFIHRLSLHFKYAALYRFRSLLNLRKANTHPGMASNLSSFTMLLCFVACDCHGHIWKIYICLSKTPECISDQFNNTAFSKRILENN